MVVAEFELTIDDLRHASRASAEAQRIAGGRSRWRATAVWLIAVTFMAAFSELMSRNLVWRYAGVVLLAAGITGCALGVTTLILSFRRPDPNRQPVQQFVTLPPAWVGRLDWALSAGVPLALFAGVVLLHVLRPTAPAPRRVSGLTQEFLVFWPWLPVLVYVALMFRGIFRSIGAYERIWKRYPTLQLRNRLEADEQGLALDDGHTREETRWFVIQRFVETPQAFLLYVSERGSYFIPKRGFVGEADVAVFRELLRRHVGGAAQGFPVQSAPPRMLKVEPSWPIPPEKL